MVLIDFKTLVSDLSDESFTELKSYTKDFLPSYFVDWKEIDKVAYIEKIGEYLKQLELKTKLRDNDLAYAFSSELCSLMKNRYIHSSAAEKYETKAYLLSKSLGSSDHVHLTEVLEDISKVFICFYSSYMRNKGPIEKMPFLVSEINYDKILKRFLADKPEPGKDVRAFMNKADHIIPGKVKDAAGKVQESVDWIGEKLAKKTDDIYEPVHDVIENDEIFNLYTKRIFSYILLTIFYLRILDFETGRSE